MQEQFIDSVHGSGVLVYLSSSWLAELYQQVLTRNFLGDAGYDRTSHDNCALINLLTGRTTFLKIFYNYNYTVTFKYDVFF